MRRLGRDRRAVSPVVGKTLEVGLALLFITMLTATLFGNAVPAARTTAGDEVGERATASAAQRIQQSVPPNVTAARATYRVDLPRTIRGEGYYLRVEDRTLVLDHPDPGIDARVPLALPSHVARVEGAWWSRNESAVRVETTGEGTVVTLK
ncbi:DUF7266 family protein [Natronomonas sp. EA1]|uniref:DUF7266 family protein n=1 Tax=Natronomonas sp. EA1 TaxID=3421655 RepID=UPI003EB86411